MPLITLAEAQPVSMHGVTFNSYARTETGAQSLGAWRADFAPHTPGQAHTMDHEEVLFVLTGRLAIELGDDAFNAVAGDAVLVPAGTRLRVSNEDAVPAQAWVTTTLGMSATMSDTGDRIRPPWAQ